MSWTSIPDVSSAKFCLLNFHVWLTGPRGYFWQPIGGDRGELTSEEMGRRRSWGKGQRGFGFLGIGCNFCTII